MYRLSSARESLIPRLMAIKNLIFINANRIVRGWKGDYPRERPENMSVIHDYSHAFAEAFPAERLVDLLTWSEDEVKIYTCDNLHLTEAGSDYIYDALLQRMFGGVMPLKIQSIGGGKNVANMLDVAKSQEDCHIELNRISAELLLDPAKALQKVEGNLAGKIETCLSRTRDDDPARQHFLRVRQFVKERQGGAA